MIITITIDENEVHHLGMLLEQMFPDANTQMVSIAINPSGSSRDGLSRVDEHAFFVFFGGSQPNPTFEDFFGPEDKTRARWWDNLMRGASAWVRSARPNQCYPILIDRNGRIAGAGEPFTDPDEASRPTHEGEYELAWPVRKDGRLGIWGVGAPRLRAMYPLGYVAVSKQRQGGYSVRYLLDGAVQAIERGEITVEGYDDQGGVILPKKQSKVVPKTMWHRARHTAGGPGGTGMVAALVERQAFSFPKSVYAVRDTLDTTVGHKPDALVIDFFAGSGTTLHATMLLNLADGGSRRCVLVTNNEVRAEATTRLHKAGFFRGDPEFERTGVFEAATRPRVTAAVTGIRADKKPIEGEYMDGRPYADGFQENVEFFRLDYVDPVAVELGMHFDDLHPLMWLAAGGIGERKPVDHSARFALPAGSPYAVLFDPSGMPGLVKALAGRPDVTHVFIVADSDRSFASLATSLPDYTVVQLYRRYLETLRGATS